MRVIFAIVGGFVFTVAVFVSGLAVAIWLLAAKPVQQAEASPDVTDLWTREPRTVKTPVEGLQRLPARHAASEVSGEQARQASETPAPEHQTAESRALGVEPEPGAFEPEAVDAVAGDAGLLDATMTGSIAGEEEQPAVPTGLSAAHVDWCSSRYRSYRVADNSYQPYSGGRRSCVSPFMEAAGGEPEFAVLADHGASEFEVQVVDGFEGENGAPVQLTSDHIEYCFSRYRSYRPEDNTYQPYGGGPRQQCQ